MVKPGRVLADPARERIGTPATIVTFIRAAASITLAAYAASHNSKTLLVIALLVHWVGDSLDGQIARMFDCETRTGAVLDILSDRLCAAAFYIGLAWLDPSLSPAIFVYLAEFMVVDGFLSICFLAWPYHQPQLLLRRRPPAVAAELVPPGQGGELRPVRDPAAGHRLDVGRPGDRAGPAGAQEHLAGAPDEAGDAALGAPLPHLVEAEERFGMDLGSATLAEAPHRFTREADPDDPARRVRLRGHPVHQHRGLPRRRGGSDQAHRCRVGGRWPPPSGRPPGKVALYHASGWAMRLPWIKKKMATPKWKESYDRWSLRVHERPNQTALLLFASASLGFPPLYVMAVLAGQMKVRLWLFISTCLTGRFIRFLVILGAADWIIHLFR